jgi:hypothetical protein
MDEGCLELCISLLDHDLKGDLFESAAVGFLAACHRLEPGCPQAAA